jgi:hypothetical protein
MENILNIISAIPLFNGLPDDQLSEIRQIAVEKQFGKGQTIFSEGDETTGLFVVVDGRIKIYKVSSEGKEQILHIFEAGQWQRADPAYIRSRAVFWRSNGFYRTTIAGQCANPGEKPPSSFPPKCLCCFGDGQSVSGVEFVGDYVKKAAPVCGSN